MGSGVSFFARCSFARAIAHGVSGVLGLRPGNVRHVVYGMWGRGGSEFWSFEFSDVLGFLMLMFLGFLNVF